MSVLSISTSDLEWKVLFFFMVGLSIFCLIMMIVSIRKKARQDISDRRIAFIAALLVTALVGAFPMISKLQESRQIENGDEAESSSQVVDESVSFEEIYHAYKENELRADDIYKGNRYRITAEVNQIEAGGFMGLGDGATLTMVTRIDSTIVVFVAEFEEEQEEALKTISVGDTITFEGECYSAGNWVDCELIFE